MLLIRVEILLVVIHLVILVMVEVGWVLGPPIDPSIIFILEQMRMMGDLGHHRLIAQHKKLSYLGLGTTELVLLVVTHLVAPMMMI